VWDNVPEVTLVEFESIEIKTLTGAGG
jgi:hypothetical protein